jgi:hypothetical protein
MEAKYGRTQSATSVQKTYHLQSFNQGSFLRWLTFSIIRKLRVMV